LPYQTDYKNAAGTVLKSVQGVVETDTTNYSYSSAAFQNTRYKSLTTILSDTNQQSKTTFTYGAFNNVTGKDETDWGDRRQGSKSGDYRE